MLYPKSWFQINQQSASEWNWKVHKHQVSGLILLHMLRCQKHDSIKLLGGLIQSILFSKQINRTFESCLFHQTCIVRSKDSRYWFCWLIDWFGDLNHSGIKVYPWTQFLSNNWIFYQNHSNPVILWSVYTGSQRKELTILWHIKCWRITQRW